MICGAEGCFNQARPRGRFCSSACRSRDWKARKSYGTSRPAPASRNGAERGSGGMGGEQLSYSKTFRNLIEDLAEFVEVHRIEVSLRRSLPARQKQRMEARGR